MLNNNERSLSWLLVLYPHEDDTHYNALEYIKKNYKDYAYIEHDSDFTSTGELKKKHTHVIIKFPNYRWRNAIAVELGITPNYLEKCKNIDNSLKYLIHFNDPDKFQYPIEKVEGTLQSKLVSLLSTCEKSESELFSEIINFVSRYNRHLTLNEFLLHICSSPDLLKTYKKYSYTILQLIREHNINYAGRD